MIDRHESAADTGRRNALVQLAGCWLGSMIGIPGAGLAKTGATGGRWKLVSGEPAWQALEIATGDTLILPARIVGSDVHAILDSGSASSILGAGLAARLGLLGTEERTIRGSSDRAKVKLIRDVDLEVGGTAQRLPTAIVADLDAVSSAFGREIDLILGLDTLSEHAVAVDFAGKRFAIALSGSLKPASDWAALPLAYGANRELLIAAAVAGLAPAPFIFDLGSSNALQLSSAYIDANHLLEGKARSTALLGGVEGVHETIAFTSDHIRLGGASVARVPTFAIERWLSTSAVGNIGFPVISQFDMILDIKAGKVWLRPAPAEARLPMLKDRSGLGFATSASALTIMHVANGSPGARSGWKVGDSITAVNGHAIDSDYTRGALWRWRYGAAGTVVALSDAARTPRELRLADYY